MGASKGAIEIEACVGCGQPVAGYPYVGIGRPGDFPAQTRAGAAVPGQSGVWEAFAICVACHQAPPRPLKLHYHARATVHVALRLAGASSLG